MGFNEPILIIKIFADFALILPHTKGNIIVKYISVQTVWAGMFSVINRHLKIIEILSLRLCYHNRNKQHAGINFSSQAFPDCIAELNKCCFPRAGMWLDHRNRI